MRVRRAVTAGDAADRSKALIKELRGHGDHAQAAHDLIVLLQAHALHNREARKRSLGPHDLDLRHQRAEEGAAGVLIVKADRCRRSIGPKIHVDPQIHAQDRPRARELLARVREVLVSGKVAVGD